ncbi:hypothetical protein IscW_ISCW017551 [Ixodes scapularis]|uniref:Uncharacterized protein n=1 Tax=Ixodes scapularis TaxID=6945 RepID=B7P7I8_IXOSC|nr:hypothetical protein IscW_ISCW017551 [Ixodes scapularis]|eukprot:XP_002399231.1 hypothetical protein IscW_ISCW017551 [Ixodes scapularis]
MVASTNRWFRQLDTVRPELATRLYRSSCCVMQTFPDDQWRSKHQRHQRRTNSALFPRRVKSSPFPTKKRARSVGHCYKPGIRFTSWTPPPPSLLHGTANCRRGSEDTSVSTCHGKSRLYSNHP